MDNLPAQLINKHKIENIVLCRLENISAQEEKVTVSLEQLPDENGKSFQIDIPFTRLFEKYKSSKWQDQHLKIYKTALAYYDDYIRNEWPFTAKIEKSSDPAKCYLSRIARIDELWEDIEKKASAAGIKDKLFQARIVGGNKDYFMAKIEGNINCCISYKDIIDFLKKHVGENKRPSWRFYVPEPGDILWGSVKEINKYPRYVLLDIITPLMELETNPNLFWGMDQTTYNAPIQFSLKTPVFPSLPSRNRDSKNYLLNVLDNDIPFSETMCWTLELMGYSAKGFTSHDLMLKELNPKNWPDVFLIDLDLDNFWGTDLADQLHHIAEEYKKPCRIILMSVFHNSRVESYIPEVRKRIESMLLWDKNVLNIEDGFRNMIELIDKYDDIIKNPEDTREHNEDILQTSDTKKGYTAAESYHDIEDLVQKIKNILGAEWAAVFRMDRSEWRVDFVAGDDLIYNRMQSPQIQSFLPNSPIREIIIDKNSPIFAHDMTSVKLRHKRFRQFRNLLRLFVDDELNDPSPEHLPIQSALGIRLELPTHEGYCIFIFSSQRGGINLASVSQIEEKIGIYLIRLEKMIFEKLNTQKTAQSSLFTRKGFILAGIGHDLANPLFNVETRLREIPDLLEKGETEKLKTNIKSTIDEVGRLHIMIQNVIEDLRQTSFKEFQIHSSIELALKTAERYLKEERRRRFNVDKKSNEVSQLVEKGKMREESFSICVGNLPKGIRVNGSKMDLTRIVENLLINAIQQTLGFYRKKGMIAVELKKDPNDTEYPITIYVRDTGPGIHYSEQEKIFQSLYTTKPDGFGMGLAIIRHLSEQLGIKVNLSQSFLLGGVEFSVHVPIQMKNPALR